MRWRLWLMPFGVIAELAVIIACWVLAVVYATKTSERLADWGAANFKSIYWYMDDE